MTKLKPCPFCGRDSAVFHTKWNGKQYYEAENKVYCRYGCVDRVEISVWQTKNKADAILDAIRLLNVGDDCIVHNEDGSIAYILRLVTKEHPEQDKNYERRQ